MEQSEIKNMNINIDNGKLFNACHNYEVIYMKYCIIKREYMKKMEEIEKPRDDFKWAEAALENAFQRLKMLTEETK